MATGTESAAGMVYRLRVVLAEVSPLIWRRIEVTGATTLAQLHEVVQTSFGWDDDHLHEFTVYGVDYGTTAGAHSLGARVCLADLGLRERERFAYTYNFFAGWCHDLRVDTITPVEPHQHYPRCVAGARRVPPPDCDSPMAYLRLRAERPRAVLRIAEIFAQLLDMPTDTRLSDVPDLVEELRTLVVYGRLDDFDRSAVNRALQTLSLTWSRCGTKSP